MDPKEYEKAVADKNSMEEYEPLDVLTLPGYVSSYEVGGTLNLLTTRKAMVNHWVRTLQTELGELPKDGSEARHRKIRQLNAFLAEQSKLNELIAGHSTLLKNTVDQILISQLRKVNPALFEELLKKAQGIYDERATRNKSGK